MPRCVLSLRTVVLSGLVPVLAAVRSAGQAPAPTTAFVDVAVVPMDRERVLPHQTVVVRGSRIVAIEKSGTVPLPAGTVVVDGRGKFLMPGLADMHVHLDYADSVDGMTADIAMMLYLANGVTTVRNMRGTPAIAALRNRAAKGELLSPRIYTAGPTIYNAEDIATPAAATALVAAHQAAGYDFIKVHEVPIDPDAFDTFAAIAHRAGIPFAGHTPRRVSVQRALRAHPASLEHLSQFVNYLLDMDTASGPWNRDSLLELRTIPDAKIAQLAQLVKQSGVWMCPTELIRLGFQHSDDTVDIQLLWNDDSIGGSQYKVWPVRRRIIKMFQEAGVRLLAGSDGGPGLLYSGLPQIPPGSEIHSELALLVKAGLTPYQALEAATRNPAAFLAALDSTGTVAVGKRADLVLVSGNPLEDIRHTAATVGTMLDGRWLSREVLNARLAAAKVPEKWYRQWLQSR